MIGLDEAISDFFSCGPGLPPPSINVTCLLESLTERLLVQGSSSLEGPQLPYCYSVLYFISYTFIGIGFSRRCLSLMYDLGLARCERILGSCALSITVVEGSTDSNLT